MLNQVLALAERLRAEGFEVSVSELIDAAHAIAAVDIGSRSELREALRGTMLKERDPAAVFDRVFRSVFEAGTPQHQAQEGTEQLGAEGRALSQTGGLHLPAVGGLDDEILRAVLEGDSDALGELAALAVQAYSGMDTAEGTERYFLHRVMRGMDLSRMLSAAMQQLRREGDLSELELMLRRNEISRGLEEFRRRLASEIADRLAERMTDEGIDIPERTSPEDLDILGLSRFELEQVRIALQPLLRKLAARIGRKRRRHSQGRLDVRRTVRRSLQFGGVPMDVVNRRRHPHKPEIVVLCDVSGSVAEFAQFTFTIVNALHDEVRNVRSFAFVDGVAEVSDVFSEARYEIAVNRLVERKGVVGLEGHSDYGSVFDRFRRLYLEDTVGSGTTLIVTGDARGNYRDAGVEHFEAIAARARRVYWLNPEPEPLWGEDDSLINRYRHACTAVHEVRTLGHLANVIAELV